MYNLKPLYVASNLEGALNYPGLPYLTKICQTKFSSHKIFLLTKFSLSSQKFVNFVRRIQNGQIFCKIFILPFNHQLNSWEYQKCFYLWLFRLTFSKSWKNFWISNEIQQLRKRLSWMITYGCRSSGLFGQKFVGQIFFSDKIFRLTKYIIWQNFRNQAKISSILARRIFVW